MIFLSPSFTKMPIARPGAPIKRLSSPRLRVPLSEQFPKTFLRFLCPLAAPISTQLVSMDAPTSSRIAAAKAGDERAAGELIDEFHARIYAFLRRLTGNETDAEDLTQRTFARVWTSLGRFAGRSSIAAWIQAGARLAKTHAG